MIMTSTAIVTITVRVIITMPDRSCARHIGQYYSVKEAMDTACFAFPEATGISCTKCGGAQ
jgi:hypothetical protein